MTDDIRDEIRDTMDESPPMVVTRDALANNETDEYGFDESETAAEHLRNALQILQSYPQLEPEDILAVRRRIEAALAKMTMHSAQTIDLMAALRASLRPK